ncbi:hypothetical protein NHX12_003797 [Muraenolepis orangiensis]|uniref:Leucine-rich repeat-containing protein 42 n=1 Tax=Muraenolepis orangiensis TaxID=630683 RepID=A0A9Q0IDL9_9TELE|nr:hypothetical protein NHX12_003797 [Muraenolepis orangiensis]
MCSPPTTDNSTLYIREAGHLRRVNNDIVLAEPNYRAPLSSSSSCRRTKPLVVLKREHFIFTYNAKGNLQYSPRSLFDMSLQFIAENIHHVDSLLDFPEQIGAKLFAATEEKCVFSDQETGPKALQVFNDAYGAMVLTSLCLRNRFPLLSERMREIKTFHSLKSLDLFGCRLGDSHEIFQHLTNSSLTGQKFISDVLNSMPLVHQNDDQTEKLHFYKPAPKPKDTPEEKENDEADDSLRHSCVNARKRQRQSEDTEARRSPPGKRFSASALTPEDMDLLDSY